VAAYGICYKLRFNQGFEFHVSYYRPAYKCRNLITRDIPSTRLQYLLVVFCKQNYVVLKKGPSYNVLHGEAGCEGIRVVECSHMLPGQC
jgi:hypothetical protein